MNVLRTPVKTGNEEVFDIQMEETVSIPTVPEPANCNDPPGTTNNSAPSLNLMEQLSKIQSSLSKIDNLENSIGAMRNLLESSVKTHDSKIANLEERNAYLEEKTIQQDIAIDDLWIAMCAKNLILHGLQDDEEENQNDLYNKVIELIKAATEIELFPDTIYRKGIFKPNSTRPVRIIFDKLSERNLLFECRNNLPDDITVKSDLPRNVRVDNAILQKKKAELEKQEGVSCQIDFKRRHVTSSNGEKFVVINGSLEPCGATKSSDAPEAKNVQQATQPRTQNFTRDSKNGGGGGAGRGKRKFQGPDPAFINGRNLRSALHKKGRTSITTSNPTTPVDEQRNLLLETNSV